MNAKVYNRCKEFQNDIEELCDKYEDICIIASHPSGEPSKDRSIQPRMLMRIAPNYGVIIQTLHSAMIDDPKLIDGLMLLAEMHKEVLVKAGLMKPESNKTGYIR